MHFEANYFIGSVAKAFPEYFYKSRVLEVGSMYVNATIRTHFSNCSYIGLDLVEGNGVDVALSGHLFSAPGSFDLVVSCESFEHNPYYKETFIRMVENTAEGGLIVFTCATEGRPEHGTKRTDAMLSPGSSQLGWDYYKNLCEEDFLDLVNDSEISIYKFWVNEASNDIYFIGLKGEVNKVFHEGVSKIDDDIKKLSHYSKIWQNYWKLVKLQDPLRLKNFEMVINEVPQTYMLESTLYWLAYEFIKSPSLYGEIISKLERYLFYYPDAKEILALYGQFQFKLGNTILARIFFEKVIALDENNYTAIQYLASLESRSGNKHKALELFKVANLLRPEQKWINGVLVKLTSDLTDIEMKGRDFFRKYHEVQDGKRLDKYIKNSEGVNTSNCEKLKLAIPGVFKPTVERKRDIIIYPYSMESHVVPTKESEMVVYDALGKPVNISGHYKSIYSNFNSAVSLGQETLNCITLEDGIYCGAFMPHYGHFILETISRLWPFVRNGDDLQNTKIVFNLFQSDRRKGLNVDKVFSGYYKEYFDAIGINKENVIFVNSPIKIKNAKVISNSVSLSNVDCFASKEAVEIWRSVNNKMSIPRTVKEKYIYISRKSVKSPVQGRILTNEDELEELLKTLGFSILIPEDLSSEVEKQSMLHDVKVVVGCVGSGLLNTVFTPKGTHVISICNPEIARINPALNHQVSMDYFCENNSYLYVEDSGNVMTNGSWNINIERFYHFINSIIASVS